MCDELVQLKALVDVVMQAHANGETDAEFLARLDAEDAAEQERLAAEYPTDDMDNQEIIRAWELSHADDEDPEEKSSFYIS